MGNYHAKKRISIQHSTFVSAALSEWLREMKVARTQLEHKCGFYKHTLAFAATPCNTGPVTPNQEWDCSRNHTLILLTREYFTPPNLELNAATNKISDIPPLTNDSARLALVLVSKRRSLVDHMGAPLSSLPLLCPGLVIW